MAIAYYAEDIELPAIKKRVVSGWVKAVAETYGKENGRYQLYLLFRREDIGGKPPISPTRLLHGYHHLRLYGRK